MWWLQISMRARSTTLYDKVCQWFPTGRCFFPVTQASSTNKTGHDDITVVESGVKHHKTNQLRSKSNTILNAKMLPIFVFITDWNIQKWHSNLLPPTSLMGSWWSWSYSSWIYNYLYNQWVSQLKLWILIPFMARCTPISCKNKNDRYDLTEI